MSIYRGVKSTQVFDSLEAARTAIPATAATSIEVWEFGQTIEFVRDPEGIDLVMYDGSRWRREATFAEATAAATAANEAALRALADAQNAQSAAGEAHQAAADAQAAADDLGGAVEAIQTIEQGTPLESGDVAIAAIDGAGAVLTARTDGINFIPCADAADRVMDKGAISVGDVDVEGGVVTEVLNGQPTERLMPDGKDFKPSSKLLQRFRDAGVGGGGLTADGWATAPDDSFTAQAGQHGAMAVDRFTDRADGVRLPVSVVNGETRKAIIVSVYGQSNGDVTRIAAEPLMWDTPPFPYHAFMLDDMNAFGSGTHRGGMMGWQGVAVPRGTRMINASEALRGCQSYASAAFSRLMMWDGPLRRTGLIRSSAWGGNALIGSSAGAGIWKDSNGDYTQSWLNWSGDIQQAYDLLTAEGYEVEAVYICFTHQEADWQTPRATYLANFLAMKAEREALIDAAMPGMRVHWFCDQASGSGYRTGSYLGGRWQSRLAIADACLPENGGDNITMVMPRYWMTMAQFADLTYETIHHSYRARVWQGEMYAHAMRAVELGQQWRCPIMSSATVNGNSVVVNFDSLLPIVIDPAFCKVRPDAGFTVSQGAIAVTGVQQTGQRQITLTCGAAPTGSVEYAYRQQDGQDVADEWPIATGAIRDAWEAPSAFDPGKKLVRAALGYQLTL